MNPAIVIPTYWAADLTELGVYDHATALDEPLPELARCLDSLDDVRGVIRTIILLVAPPSAQEAARARVNAIVRDHKNLNPMVIGSREACLITSRVEGICPGIDGDPVSLRGYGSIRNLGLAVCAMLGHDVCVFMDDDEVALTPEFLVDAVYGLGQLTRQDLKVLAKTGHFVDSEGSHLAGGPKKHFWERWWTKRNDFNSWMQRALSGTRICRSSIACGGCMAVHASAFSQVPFDPWVTRGEDLDYLFNLRLVGLDMWFDGQWYVKHLPPATADEPNRFLQDVYRWLYERAKLTFCAQQPGLRQVTAASLMPYPGQWIGPELEERIRKTTLARVFTGPGRGASLRIFTKGRQEARAYAEANRKNYARLLNFWPTVIDGLWQDEELAAEVAAITPGANAARAAARPASPDALLVDDDAGPLGVAAGKSAPAEPAPAAQPAPAPAAPAPAAPAPATPASSEPTPKEEAE